MRTQPQRYKSPKIRVLSWLGNDAEPKPETWAHEKRSKSTRCSATTGTRAGLAPRLWSRLGFLSHRKSNVYYGYIYFRNHVNFIGLAKLTFTLTPRQWYPTPVLLPGKSHRRRSLVDCRPWGCQESDTTERLRFHFSLWCIGEGNGNPLQCSCLENPRDSGAWWAAVYRVAQSQTRLKWLSSSNPLGQIILLPILQMKSWRLEVLSTCSKPHYLYELYFITIAFKFLVTNKIICWGWKLEVSKSSKSWDSGTVYAEQCHVHNRYSFNI